MKEFTNLSLVASDLKIITMLEPSRMLQDDMPQDHPGWRGNAAPHSIDLWLWGLQGMQSLILGPVLNTQQSSELETGGLSETDLPQPKPFLSGGRISRCRNLHAQNTGMWAAEIDEGGYPASLASIGVWLLMHQSYLIKWYLLLWETLLSYPFPTIRNLAGLGRK